MPADPLDLLSTNEILLMRWWHDPLWALPVGVADRFARMAAVYAAEDVASGERSGRTRGWPVRREDRRAMRQDDRRGRREGAAA